MKLNVKRTLTIGVGFMTIMMLWQVYNWCVPLFLGEFLQGLNVSELVIGIIMALDNLFALFMIPIMSKLSDKTVSKMGRRMPYIAVGILSSAIAFVLLPLSRLTGSIWLMIANLLLVLTCMNIYRSPCVALMPDITPKALRSKGNSIINIMGGIGTATGFLLVMLLGNDPAMPFIGTTLIMLGCLVFLLLKVKEVRFVEEYRAELKKQGISVEDDQKEDVEVGTRQVANKRNLWLILGIVFLVYMANNAVETFISTYAKAVFGGTTFNLFGMSLKVDVLTVAPFGVGTFAFAVPAAVFAEKIGRKNVVLIGAILMLSAYLGMATFATFSWFMLLFFFVGGMGFALICINIYPMVVDNCDAGSTGKFTGYYYTASMLAQSVTPALSGLFMSGLIFNSMRALFPYAAVFMALAIAVTLMVKNDKVERTGKESADEN